MFRTQELSVEIYGTPVGNQVYMYKKLSVFWLTFAHHWNVYD
jgi:hypothetical protein